jgi:hypothetical protein
MARKTLHCPAAKLRDGDQCPQSTCPVRVRRMRLLRKNRRSEYGAFGRVIILWRAIARIQGPSGASSSQTLPFEANGEQRFLHNILGILIALSGSSQAAARQAAKDKGQLQQQFPVSMSKAHWFSWLSAPTRCPLVLFGPCGPCVTCPIHIRYQVLVITDMRGRCNGKAREIVREGVETACRVSSWEGGEPQL